MSLLRNCRVPSLTPKTATIPWITAVPAVRRLRSLRAPGALLMSAQHRSGPARAQCPCSGMKRTANGQEPTAAEGHRRSSSEILRPAYSLNCCRLRPTRYIAAAAQRFRDFAQRESQSGCCADWRRPRSADLLRSPAAQHGRSSPAASRPQIAS